MANIAVESGLHEYANYLRNSGYTVEEFHGDMKNNSSFFNRFDAIVTSKTDDNAFDLEDEITSSSVINSDLLNIQGGLSTHYAVNTGLLNENAFGLRRHSSVPTIYANERTPEQVKDAIDAALS
ncbi:hypothetical protein GOM49_01580 [Clostridium bovifaecis]|uniref:Uncharacterized protein n=1 Tax=Clostridium bovifaecis TaxID=2184719 RepID=A0A6I6EZI8_9CLOT|nr:hypothetical protein GOM49_01580 [Clostridium bovifaecis]